MPENQFDKSHILGIRAFCILGIIFGHSYIPGVYETGYIWRIPLLFLVGGTALIKPHPLIKTSKFIFSGLYIYIAIWSAAYLLALYWIFGGQPNKFAQSFDVSPILLQDVFIHNNHRNALVLGAWFLIPYGIALFLLSIAKKLPGFDRLHLPLSACLLVLAFLLVDHERIGWQLRILSQTAMAGGLMILGRYIFTTPRALRFIENGWTISISFAVALWLTRAFGETGVTWSWMTGRGHYWLTLPAMLLYAPAVVWIGRQLSPYRTARFIGGQSKHIMTHHLFGFLIVNLLMAKLGYITYDQIDVFFIPRGALTWPVYLGVSLGWSLIAATVSNRVAREFRRGKELLILATSRTS